MYENFRKDIVWATQQAKQSGPSAFNMDTFLLLAPFEVTGKGDAEEKAFVRAEESYLAKVR